MIQIKDLVIEINGFVKNYEDLSVKKGSVVMIVGANGSGKTVFLNSICGLLNYKSGSIFLNGINSQDDSWKGFTTCFLDKNFLIPYLKPLEYFELCLLLANKKNKENIDIYSKALTFKAFNKQIKNLSLGNQKKVGLISSLITSPEIIIWDEPFANLDKETSNNLNKLLIELSNLGKTIIYTNHPTEETYHSKVYNI